MGIITITPGSYTPGAQSSLDAMASVINAAWDLGNAKYDDYETKVAALTDEVTGWLSTQAAPHVAAGTVTIPTVIEPVVDIPATQSADDIYADFAAEYAKLIQELSGQFTSFLTTYCPNDATVYSAAEAWIQSAIANDSGLPSSVAAQILTDDKDRILADADRASETILATFAARRFPLPPGAAAAAISEVVIKAQNEIAASSRKLIIASVEQHRWVIEKAVGLRQLAMGSATEFIKALASGPDIASRLVNVGYDAQSKLISSVSQLLNSRTAVEELKAKVGQFNEQLALQAGEKNQAADMSMIENRLKALLTECQALAQMVTSLFNNVHASAGTSYSVNGT